MCSQPNAGAYVAAIASGVSEVHIDAAPVRDGDAGIPRTHRGRFNLNGTAAARCEDVLTRIANAP